MPIVTKNQAPAGRTYPRGVTLNIESFLDLTMYPFYEISGRVRKGFGDGLGWWHDGKAERDGSAQKGGILRNEPNSYCFFSGDK